ncbi:MAG: Ycf51 family protein [Cyanobacteria bacterium P01_D01_bin.36]
MLSPEQFLIATGYFAIGTLLFAVITALAFVLKWGFRFRLVGATGFMGVLTAGMFGLSFQPLTQTVIPGAVPYTTVFDSGASQIVIAVPGDIDRTALEATLQQAASNLLKPSRIGGMGQAVPVIRARAIAHTGGTSELLYLGKVTPNQSKGKTAEEKAPIIEIYADQLAKANRTAS